VGGPSNRARRHAAEYVTPPLKKQSDPGIVEVDRQKLSTASASLLQRSGKTEIVNFD
jgi:hypothetical protein